MTSVYDSLFLKIIYFPLDYPPIFFSDSPPLSPFLQFENKPGISIRKGKAIPEGIPTFFYFSWWSPSSHWYVTDEYKKKRSLQPFNKLYGKWLIVQMRRSPLMIKSQTVIFQSVEFRAVVSYATSAENFYVQLTPEDFVELRRSVWTSTPLIPLI
jgi:hypothetical protein